MEYSAASVKFLLWYVETKETAKLLQDHTFDEIKKWYLCKIFISRDQRPGSRVNLAA